MSDIEAEEEGCVQSEDFRSLMEKLLPDYDIREEKKAEPKKLEPGVCTTHEEYRSLNISTVLHAPEHAGLYHRIENSSYLRDSVGTTLEEVQI